MVRLSVGALAALALTACNGLIDGGGGNTTPEQQVAINAWNSKAWPVLMTSCQGCHAGTTAGVEFLAGANPMAVRDTLLGFAVQVVNLEAPESSRLLTKGPHNGPALTGDQATDVLEWIRAERDAAGVTPDQGLQTGKFTPLICTGGNPGDATCPVNHIDLSAVQLPGASIDMVVQALSQDIYVTDLKLNASVDGVYLEHPLFVSWPADPSADPIPDSLDRFFNVKLNLMPTDAPAQFNGGTAAFIGFSPTNQMSITFKVVDKYRPDTGGGGGGGTGATGCKSLATFKSNAQSALNTNCASCHAAAGNTNARGAMDITGITSTDDATLQTACDQARTRINFQNTAMSGFYIAPNPSDPTNHQFKFGSTTLYDNFKAAVDVWVQAEKTAQ